jgi:hypothetical protein
VIRGSVQRLTSNRCAQPDDRHGKNGATKEAIRFQAHRVAPGSVQSQRAAPSGGRSSCVSVVGRGRATAKSGVAPGVAPFLDHAGQLLLSRVKTGVMLHR